MTETYGIPMHASPYEEMASLNFTEHDLFERKNLVQLIEAMLISKVGILIQRTRWFT